MPQIFDILKDSIPACMITQTKGFFNRKVYKAKIYWNESLQKNTILFCNRIAFLKSEDKYLLYDTQPGWDEKESSYDSEQEVIEVLLKKGIHPGLIEQTLDIYSNLDFNTYELTSNSFINYYKSKTGTYALVLSTPIKNVDYNFLIISYNKETGYTVYDKGIKRCNTKDVSVIESFIKKSGFKNYISKNEFDDYVSTAVEYSDSGILPPDKY